MNLNTLTMWRTSPFTGINSVYFAALISLFFVVFYNAAFFAAVHNAVNSFSLVGGFFTLCLGLLFWLLTFVLLNLVVVPYIAKPLFVALVCVAAAVAYFMNAYGVVIHRLMIQNTAETDLAEVASLLSPALFVHLLFWGVLPSIIIVRTRINYANPLTEIFRKITTTCIAFVIALALVLSMSADFTAFFKEHKDLRQRANPLNFIYALITYIAENNNSHVVASIGLDAKLDDVGTAQAKPTLLVVVVGETARADHFGINGYARNTTPLIAREEIINYPHVRSCGTETAVSVPCMFSLLGRKHYSDREAKSQESVLDVIKHAGIFVYWRDNNSGCKGVCDRVIYENVQKWTVPAVCNNRECFDDVLLYQLNEKLNEINANKTLTSVIVLHQKGSHGPDYYHRYPESFELFKPACHTNQLQDCTLDEVNNGYDNSIHYTDHFLAKTIDWLKAQSVNYNTAMIYLSDHGESLGEHNIYLHGMPYMIAPEAQTHVPFFLWFSPEFEQSAGVNRQCLLGNAQKEYSQDNLPHTLLGLLNINTQVYNPALDLVNACRNYAQQFPDKNTTKLAMKLQ